MKTKANKATEALTTATGTGTQTTAEKLRAAALALAEAETERDPVPAAIEKMCAARVGKPVTKKDAADLEAQFPGLSVSIIKDFGVRLKYWTPVSLGGYDDGKRLPDDHVSANGYTGERTSDGEPIYSKTLAAKQIALYRMGVPTSQSAYGIEVRSYHDARSGGVTRWPTVEELRKMNPSSYGARDERNATRAKNRAAIEAGAVQLETIARLVDELNLIAGELTAYVNDEGTPAELARVVTETLVVSLTKKGR